MLGSWSASSAVTGGSAQSRPHHMCPPTVQKLTSGIRACSDTVVCGPCDEAGDVCRAQRPAGLAVDELQERSVEHARVVPNDRANAKKRPQTQPRMRLWLCMQLERVRHRSETRAYRDVLTTKDGHASGGYVPCRESRSADDGATRPKAASEGACLRGASARRHRGVQAQPRRQERQQPLCSTASCCRCHPQCTRRATECATHEASLRQQRWRQQRQQCLICVPGPALLPAAACHCEHRPEATARWRPLQPHCAATAQGVMSRAVQEARRARMCCRRG